MVWIAVWIEASSRSDGSRLAGWWAREAMGGARRWAQSQGLGSLLVKTGWAKKVTRGVQTARMGIRNTGEVETEDVSRHT